MKQAFTAVLLGILPALTGCLTHTHSVPLVRRADVVMDASLDHLITQVNDQFNAIQTMSASVEIVASTGGSLKGSVTESPSFSGYLFLRKPESMRVLLLVPVLRTRALDMVSDGKDFKLLIPSKNKAMVGLDQVITPSKNGLENLRPFVFFDSLLVRGIQDDEIVSRTSDVRIIETTGRKKELIEEPDYDLQILAQPQGHMQRTLRVIHISRANLQPYQQDIYDNSGRIVTRAFYSDYQMYGSIPFPTHIIIKRPLDQYSLTLTITKLSFNQPLDSDQFDLKIPDNVTVQTMH